MKVSSLLNSWLINLSTNWGRSESVASSIFKAFVSAKLLSSSLSFKQPAKAMSSCSLAWHITCERCYSNICILQGVCYKTSQRTRCSLTAVPVARWAGSKTHASPQPSRRCRLFVFPGRATPLPKQPRRKSKCENCSASKRLFVLPPKSNFWTKLYLHM